MEPNTGPKTGPVMAPKMEPIIFAYFCCVIATTSSGLVCVFTE
jgi:hypothetical protein